MMMRIALGFLLFVSSLNADFVSDWSKYYQTSLDSSKENRARLVISNGYIVPTSAQKAIEIAADIFQGDEGKTRNQLIKYLSHTGAVESLYKTKIQYGNGPARSYWQVEPKTAMDVVKNSSAYFGKKFHAKYGKNALKKLQSLNEAQWADVLEKYDEIGAIMATAKWLATNW